MEKLNIECSCGSRKLHLEPKGSQTGIYCNECGKWMKWASKQELRLLKSESTRSEFVQKQGDKAPLDVQIQRNSYLKDSCVMACLPCAPNAKLYTVKAAKTGAGKWVEQIVELHIDHFVVFDAELPVRVVCHDKDGLSYSFESEDFGDSVFFSREELQGESDMNARERDELDAREDSVPF